MAPTSSKKSVRRGRVSKARKSQIMTMTAARLAKTAAKAPMESVPADSTPGSAATPGPSVYQPQDSDPLAPRMSASKRKLGVISDVPIPSGGSKALPITVVDLQVVAQLFAPLLCPQCKCPTLELTVDDKLRMSFVAYLRVTCTNCEEVASEGYTSQTTTKDQSMEINRKLVCAGLNVGAGHSNLMKFAEVVGMPGMHLKTHQSHVEKIFMSVQSTFVDLVLQDARARLWRHYQEHNPAAIGEDGILNVAVSFDGSWAKRGHTSKIGFASVIEVMTGLVIDFHVMSLFCQICATTGEPLRKRNAQEYEAWLVKHKESGTCTKNYEGSSGGMEKAGALVIWGRSLKYKCRFNMMVGDGDANTFLALTNLSPYGAEHPVQKEECVNHVSKRLNTALRNLKTTLGKQKVRIGGHAKGSLTDVKIGTLQTYYTKAVRTYNTSVEEMANAVWAAYYHSISSDDTPQHNSCPKGVDSWCWFQKQLAEGVKHPVRKEGDPPSTFLNSTVAEHVKPIYERLTRPDLLGRCLLGATQNANESLHSVIWAKCPKHNFTGYKRVQIATTLAVGEFNAGSVSTRQLMSAIGCRINSVTVEMGCKRDRQRIARAEEAQRDVAKQRREKRKLAQARRQQEVVAAEGGPSYISGGF
ncbi:hypothetical protein ElyMa_006020700 [Elysia marginata]|uniref:Mutator-like transposase domain-containing protein n=1 Tax=Elysia marginata TaxID=1093978 RepID=A0AAV4GHH7_9GAST|nr:hypothetical protein ElyMa_006020700 [Elysia marginata]